ncbi:MAG: hypothetical protein KKA73_15645 [Chloroflexi bacterium]|nr:hypothetical protein [Chloroflexota bacterium]MBU1749118.1 hypothetical protein [Chloroflexota bacterium]
MNWLRGRVGFGTRAPALMLSSMNTMPRRVSLIIHNPVIRSEGGRKLTEVLGWEDPDALAAQYIADLREISGGQVEYEIVERIEVDGWVPKRDGFVYDENTYLACWRNQAGFHQPDEADYRAVAAEFDLARKVETGVIDEAWLFAYPYAGYYESRMAGPGAFWCNAPSLPLPSSQLSRRFVIMGFNYERMVGYMLESFGHRVESIMNRVWRGRFGEANLWNRFVRYDQVAPGRANCGNVHFAPNSVQDYDWGNPAYVLSNCDDWLTFPNLAGQTRQVNCAEWGDGDIRAHHHWWLKHLPRVPGATQGILNNWWVYVVDPNTV